ncbi:MAG: DUF1211 domain-containing protein [Chlorobiaceae bacterium]|nr:DUF1211 domain-containing protein [Chlorobiaceae bacterium]
MNERNETTRIEAFSDGVFAIAVTLLVIEVKVPDHVHVDRVGLLRALLEIWPSYLAYLTSFATILVIWVHHHWIFSLINKYDHGLFYLNGLLLLFVTFIPFPTALLSEYLLHRDARVAASFYTGIFLAISLSSDILWRHVSINLLSENAISGKTEEVMQITRHYRFGPLLYTGAFAMSFVSEPLSVILCLLLALFFSFRRWSINKPE